MINRQFIREWQTEAGLTAVIILIDGGGLGSWLTGYVGVPFKHVFYGIDYDAILNYSTNQTIENSIIVHGGITYAGNTDDYPIKSELWWFGFDCAHAGDTLEICNESFVKNECESLAKQLAEKV